MILLWSERKLLARIVFISSNTVSLVSSLLFSLQLAIDCLEQFIIADSAKQFRLRMRSSPFYLLTAPPLFQFTVLSGFARFRIKEVRISEVLLQYFLSVHSLYIYFVT